MKKTNMKDYYNCMNEVLIVLHKYKNTTLRPRHLEMILCDCLEFIKIDFNDTTDIKKIENKRNDKCLSCGMSLKNCQKNKGCCMDCDHE